MRVPGRIPSGWVTAALLLPWFSGCQTLPADVDTYTLIELKNPLSEVRPNEVVEVPLRLVKAKYPAFHAADFSVHEVPRSYYSSGDPMLATDPYPEVPAQVVDRDYDGDVDTILVSLNFTAGETKTIAIASPRFSRLIPRPTNTVRCRLWQRQVVRDDGANRTGEGPYIEVPDAVMPLRLQASSGLFFLGGPILENELQALRLVFDARLGMDLVGKTSPEILLEAAGDAQSVSEFPGAFSVLGDPSAFGAGSLGFQLDGKIVPLQKFESAQYLKISDGPVAAEAEIILSGARMGEESFDLNWHITTFRGQPYQRHFVRLSRTGHSLAFAMSHAGGFQRYTPITKLGWMRAVSVGPENVTTGAGGVLACGVLSRRSQLSMMNEEEQDGVVGLCFSRNLRQLEWLSMTQWKPGSAADPLTFERQMEELVMRLRDESRIKVRSLDPPGI